MAAFSLAILAGMGMDYYAKHARTDPRFSKFLRQILVLGFLLSFIYLMFNLNFDPACNFLKKMILNISDNFSHRIDRIEQIVTTGLYNIRRGMGLFMFLSVVMFFGIKKRLNLNIVLIFILLAAFVDVFTANKNVYQNMDIKEFLKPGSAVEFLQKDKALFRIFDSPATLRQNMFVPEKGYFEGNIGLRERAVSQDAGTLGQERRPGRLIF